MSQITTPQQLGNWVDALLTQVESRLNERNKQVENRSMLYTNAVNEMADRIDALEASIQGMYFGLTQNLCMAPNLARALLLPPRRHNDRAHCFYVFVF